jgi:hypothetical protein
MSVIAEEINKIGPKPRIYGKAMNFDISLSLKATPLHLLIFVFVPHSLNRSLQKYINRSQSLSSICFKLVTFLPIILLRNSHAGALSTSLKNIDLKCCFHTFRRKFLVRLLQINPRGRPSLSAFSYELQ